MNDSPLVSVVIPNFNGKNLLRECLFSLENQEYRNIEVIVVDNESNDGSIEMVKKEYPWVKLLETERIRVSEACNRAMRIAKGEVVVTLLNNDMTVERYCLQNLVCALRGSDVGVVGGKIYRHETNIIQSAGGWIDWDVGTGGQIGCGEKDRDQYNSVREVDYVDVPTVRRDVMNKIGGYDEGYYHYFVDTDYCIRARKAGYKILYIPSAIIWHRSSATLGTLTKRQYYSSQRDSIRFLVKNSPVPVIYYRLCCRLWYLLKTMAINLYKKRPHFIGLQICAVIWNLTHLKETLRARQAMPLNRGVP